MNKSICLYFGRDLYDFYSRREIFAIYENKVEIGYLFVDFDSFGGECYSESRDIVFPDDPIFTYSINKIIEISEDEANQAADPENNHSGRTAFVSTGTEEETASCFKDLMRFKDSFKYTVKTDMIQQYLVYVLLCLRIKYKGSIFEDAMKNKDSIVESVKKEYEQRIND